jgi:hypothetical protein
LIAKMARLAINKRRMKKKDKKYVEAWTNQFSLVQPHTLLATKMIGNIQILWKLVPTSFSGQSHPFPQ